MKIAQIRKSVDAARIRMLSVSGKGFPGMDNRADIKFDGLSKQILDASRRLYHWERMLMERNDILARRKAKKAA